MCKLMSMEDAKYEQRRPRRTHATLAVGHRSLRGLLPMTGRCSACRSQSRSASKCAHTTSAQRRAAAHHCGKSLHHCAGARATLPAMHSCAWAAEELSKRERLPLGTNMHEARSGATWRKACGRRRIARRGGCEPTQGTQRTACRSCCRLKVNQDTREVWSGVRGEWAKPRPRQ